MSSFHGEQTHAYLIMKNYELTKKTRSFLPTQFGINQESINFTVTSQQMVVQKGITPKEPDVRLLSYCGLPSYLQYHNFLVDEKASGCWAGESQSGHFPTVSCMY